MAQQAYRDEALIASLVEAYKLSNGLDWGELAGQMGLSEEQLARLALCRRPAGQEQSTQITQIATYVAMKSETLQNWLGRLEESATQPARARIKSMPGQQALSDSRRAKEIHMFRNIAKWGLVAAGILLVIGMIVAQPQRTEATLVMNEGQATLVQRQNVLFSLAYSRQIEVAGGDIITVRAGDQVSMGADASGQLRLLDGSTVDLLEDTQVTITELQSTDQATRFRLDVLAGSTYQRVQRLLGAGDMFQISTPSSTASVRGTAFAVEVISPEASYFAVDEGVVAVSLGDQIVEVQAGQEVTAMAGQPLEVREKRDPLAPGLTLVSPVTPPAAGTVVTVSGYATIGSTVTVAGQTVTLDESGFFEIQVTAGAEPIVIVATSPSGETATATINTQ